MCCTMTTGHRWVWRRSGGGGEGGAAYVCGALLRGSDDGGERLLQRVCLGLTQRQRDAPPRGVDICDLALHPLSCTSLALRKREYLQSGRANARVICANAPANRSAYSARGSQRPSVAVPWRRRQPSRARMDCQASTRGSGAGFATVAEVPGDLITRCVCAWRVRCWEQRKRASLTSSRQQTGAQKDPLVVSSSCFEAINVNCKRVSSSLPQFCHTRPAPKCRITHRPLATGVTVRA